MVALRSWRRRSDNVCTVSCNDPSPVTRMFLFMLPFSFPATKLPRAAPVAKPILPNTVWLYMSTLRRYLSNKYIFFAYSIIIIKLIYKNKNINAAYKYIL